MIIDPISFLLPATPEETGEVATLSHTYTHTLLDTLRQIALTFDPLMRDVTSLRPCQVNRLWSVCRNDHLPCRLQGGSAGARWSQDSHSV